MVSIYQKIKELMKDLSKKAEIAWIKNNYTPLNGVGVKGTWDINITGKAHLADTANNVPWEYVSDKPKLVIVESFDKENGVLKLKSLN